MSGPRQPSWLRLTSAPLIFVDASGETLLAANDAARRVLSFTADLPGDLSAVIGETSSRRFVQAAVAATGSEFRIVLICRTGAGLRSLRFDGIKDTDGIAITLAPPLPDDRAWLASLEEVASGLPIGLEIYDAKFRPLLCNEVSDQFFEYPGIYMDHHDDWWPAAFPDPSERAKAFQEWQQRLVEARAAPGQSSGAEWKVRCADGIERLFEFRFRFVGELYTVVFWDVTERRRIEEEWREHARTDVLTGLANRRSFFEEAEIMRRNTALGHEELSLLMLDIDRFKAINDQYGHGVGDHVLRVIAERCRRALRVGDLLARLGGEEFALLLPSTGPLEAAEVGRQLNAVVAAQPIECGPASVDVRISIGGATRHHPEEPLESLLDRADRALYQAKAGGRDRVEFLP